MSHQHFFSDKNIPGFDPLNADSKELFELSLKFANGDGFDVDYVAAHVCLNIASVRGCQDSVIYRKELSYDMSHDEIALAQKEARFFIEVIRKCATN